MCLHGVLLPKAVFVFSSFILFYNSYFYFKILKNKININKLIFFEYNFIFSPYSTYTNCIPVTNLLKLVFCYGI